MTSKRIENIALVFGIMTAFTVYSSAKQPPIKTSGLFAALFMSFATYALSKWAGRLKSCEQLENNRASTENAAIENSTIHQINKESEQ